MSAERPEQTALRLREQARRADRLQRAVCGRFVAGAERALKRPGDFIRYLNSPVLVKLYRNQNGRKEFAGHLTAYDEATGSITITVGKQELTFEKKDVALVRLRVEF